MLLAIIRLILWILGLTSLLIIVRTVIYRRRHPALTPLKGIPVKPQEIANHLAESIRCQTVPLDEKGTPNKKEFKKLHNFLKATYPLVHKQLKREVITVTACCISGKAASRRSSRCSLWPTKM
jgi:carboxypeptidase PM20D1